MEQDARTVARDIVINFWEDFDRTLSPRKTTRQVRREMLEQLREGIESRLKRVLEEMVRGIP